MSALSSQLGVRLPDVRQLWAASEGHPSTRVVAELTDRFLGDHPVCGEGGGRGSAPSIPSRGEPASENTTQVPAPRAPPDVITNSTSAGLYTLTALRDIDGWRLVAYQNKHLGTH